MFANKTKIRSFAVIALITFITVNIFAIPSASALTSQDISDIINAAQSGASVSDLIGAGDTNSQSESMQDKLPGPKVNVTFTSTEVLKQGSKITAKAVPSYFKDVDTSKLYFTWYLKKSGCDLTDVNDPSGEKNSTKENDQNKINNCDLDGDKKITVNDWKIAAARIVVSGSFAKADADYSVADNSNFNDSLSGAKADPIVYSSDAKENKEAWNKTYDPDLDNNIDAPNCYVQEPESGIIYELRKTEPVFNPCPDDSAGNHYHPACVGSASPTCSVLNPNFKSSQTPTNQAEITQAIANGTTPPDPIYNPPKTISQTFGACIVKSQSDNNSDNIANNFSCSIKDDAALKNYSATLSCKDSNTPICVKDGDNTDFNDTTGTTPKLLGRIFKFQSTDSEMCSALAKPNPLAPPAYLDNTQAALTSDQENCSTLTNEIINGTKNSDGTTALKGDGTRSPSCTFERGANLCKHLFPYFPEKNVTVTDFVNGKSVDTTIDTSGFKVGDGKFSLEEKHFWGANPAVDSTNGKGKDEANVMGQGVDTFTWTYVTGDQVGVAVEGTTTLQTDHPDASYRTMWAFSNGVCPALKDVSSDNKDALKDGTRAFYVDDYSSNNNKVGILTADFDLNRCLNDNLLDPAESDNFAKMSVALNATPNNPINDPDGRGDTVTVTADASNSQDVSGLLYDWQIQKSLDGPVVPSDQTNWIDITNDMRDKYNSFTETQRYGLGKNTFSFNLNLPEDFLKQGISANLTNGGIYYLRARVKVKENSGTGSQQSMGEIVIKIYEQKNQIRIYPVRANNDGTLSISDGTSTIDTEICSGKVDPSEKSRCNVTPFEVLGIEVDNAGNNKLSNFSWKINGNQFDCTNQISQDCKKGNVLFFPILGNVGEAVDVVVQATNAASGDHVEISRHFVIVQPQVSIYSTDYSIAWPRLLGYYKDNDGNRTPDYSSQVMETFSGNKITLAAVSYSSWMENNAGYTWTVDGQDVSSDPGDGTTPYTTNAGSQIVIPINKQSGDSYNVSLVKNFNTSNNDQQITNLRKIILNDWKLTPDDTIDADQNASMQINVVDSPTVGIAPTSQQTGLMASLVTHLPEQLFFLLKITLTSFALLSITTLLFVLTGEAQFEKERDFS